MAWYVILTPSRGEDEEVIEVGTLPTEGQKWWKDPVFRQLDPRRRAIIMPLIAASGETDGVRISGGGGHGGGGGSGGVEGYVC